MLLSRVIPCAFVVCFINISVPESILSPGEILTNIGIKTEGHPGFLMGECFSVDGL